MKKLHIVIALIFIVFAAVQYNDPDPLLWMLIYGSVSLVAIVKIKFYQINFKPLILTLIVIYLLFAATYIPNFLQFINQPDKVEVVSKMQAEKPWIEGTRELGGLLIAIGALWFMRQKDAQ